MTQEQKEAFKAAYVTHRQWFTKNGAPISFGRMEGFKELAEILGEADLVAWIASDADEHYSELKAMVGSR